GVLANRSGEVIVAYRDHPMPLGSSAAAARIGVGPAGSGRALYVERGMTYAGDEEEVGAWLTEGVLYFPNFGALWEWAATAFRQIVPPPPSAVVPVSQRPSVPNLLTVTDLDSVEAPTAVDRSVSEIDLRSAVLTHISGQEVAVSKLAAGIARHVGKRYPRKPYSALLMGKTSVGKTETTRVLAEALSELTGSAWEFVRLDMAEFSERFSVTRIVGAPPGYVGHGDGNDLASRLAANPRTVVLFDEFEKASPVVWQSLLGLLDRGRLASERHGMVTAEQAVLIFTSNVGADIDSEHLGDEDAARAVLRHHGLAPELVGRFGNVVAFADLSTDAMAEIAARSVSLIAADFGIELTWISPAYLTDLLQRLVGNNFGVRMVEYLVEADLGEQFGAWSQSEARVEFDGVPVLVETKDQRPEGGAK
ncbi:MAG: clpB, partial [Marmoricola sp.]|nr:clpB [Marmoricola sp.]